MFTTGANDKLGVRLALLLIPSGANVPCYTGVAGIPADLDALAVARLVIRRPDPAQRVVEFAGGEWLVKASDTPAGPGPNRFSASEENVSVDSQGRLHLRVVSRDSRWYSAEVISRRSVGLGTYRFTIDTAPRLSPGLVFGAFTYAEGESDSREIDALEIGMFGRSDNTNAQYVVQPWELPGHLTRLALPDSAPSTHVMRWEPDRIVFQSFQGEEPLESNKVGEWVFTGRAPSATDAEINFRFNLWLYDQNGRAAEVIIRNFRYEPLSESSPRPVPAAVTDSASYQPTGAPGGLVSIFGEALAARTAAAERTPLPIELAGTSVLVNGLPAPMLYASASQINLQVPYLAPPGPAVLEIRTERSSAVAPFWLRPSAPAFFINPPNSCLAQNPGLSLNSAAAPAAPGSVVVAYATGLGQVSPPVPSGSVAPDSPLSRPAPPARVTIDGQNADLEFLGLTPRLVGLGQLNLRIPSTLQPGLHAVTLRVGDADSNTCLLAVGTEPLAIPPPAIRSVSPQTGRPGDLVLISGAGFQPGATAMFGNTPASRTAYVDHQTLRATAPSADGASNITVLNPDGQSATLPNAFTYLGALTVTRVSPSSGPAAGGAVVTIHGANFVPGATVRFGAMPADSTAFISASELRATAPPGLGVVDVSVTNADGQTATLPNAFTYAVPAPVVTGISPDSGPEPGGTLVTISGNHFQSGAKVYFGQNEAPAVQFLGLSTLRATTPAGSGLVSVRILNPDSQGATLPNAFTYSKPPTVSGVSPSSGPSAGGTSVTISGAGFAPGASVRFSAALATNVSFIASTTIRATSPPGSGVASVTVTNPDLQTGSLSAAFTYLDAKPSITARIQGCSVSGTVSGVAPPSGYRILVWAYTNQHYIQPCDNERTQPIRSNATWGPIDSHNGQIWVQLVRSGYTPPASAGGLPAVDGVNVLATHGPVGTLSGCNVARCPAQ